MSKRYFVFSILLVFLTGCTGIPEGFTPVTGFDADRYLGTWYEIARLDHRFERGLDGVTATYVAREDGGIDVINRGYDRRDGEWREATGKAYFVSGRDTGHLKVSFFGPFYGSYVVFDLGENYDYALITGNDTSYFWLLARTPELPDAQLRTLIDRAGRAGFDVDELIYVNHAIQ